MKKATTESSSLHVGLVFLALGIVAVTIGIVTGKGANIVSLLASTTSSLYTAPATIFLTPIENKEELTVGETVNIHVNVFANTPINVVGATITFPTEKVDVLGISKEASFLDLWTEDTVIREDVGEVRFSGGTTAKGGHTESGTLLTLTVRIKEPGAITFDFADVEMYGATDPGKVLHHEARTLTYTGVPEPLLAGESAPATVTSPESAATRPSPDINQDGTVSLVDVSIFAIRMLGSYNPRIDLDLNGSLGISDLSILFARITR